MGSFRGRVMSCPTCEAGEMPRRGQICATATRTDALHLVRNLVRLAVFAREHGVGFFVPDEALGLRVHLEGHPEACLGAFEIHVIDLEMLRHAVKGFAKELVALDALLDLVRILLLP